MELKPLSNHIFLEPLEEEKTTKSGIVLPDTASGKKPNRGKVLAVGSGKVRDDGTVQQMSVKVGDMVLFKQYSENEVEMDDKKYWVISEDDILAIIN